MLHTNFQAPESSGSKEEDTEYFSMYFYGQNPGPPGVGQFWTLGPSFE